MQPSQKVRLWGRTFFSTDPVATANFFVKHFAAIHVPLPSCGIAERAAVKLSTVVAGFPPQQRLVFINDPAAPTGTWNATQTVAEAEAMTLYALTGGGEYTPWLDNHDGYQGEGPFDGVVMNVTAALEDGVVMGLFEGPELLRVYIPGTLWTMELSLNDAGRETLHGVSAMESDPSIFGCTTGVAPSQEGGTRSGWWKATYMSSHPEVAAQFMVDILGAKHIGSPYPWPPSDDCIAAKWTHFEGDEFDVHFVLAKEFETANFSIAEEVQAMSGFRALESGSFHASMYNSLVLEVDSLDEYLFRLKAQNMPYMLMQTTSKQYALFMIIPKNAITVQLRSQHLSVEEPISESMCTEDFGQMAF